MTELASSSALLSLGEVTASTGMAADVLRAWERRYGFPKPSRDRRGRRVYSRGQVQHLLLLRRLVDSGDKPSRIIGLPPALLEARAASLIDRSANTTALIGYSQMVEQSIALLEQDRLDLLVQELRRDLALQGARRFVLETASALTVAVGSAWQTGRLAVHQEHAFSQILLAALAVARQAALAGSGPKFLLTTAPGEAHGLGLAMAETMIAMEGGRCVGLGLETPLDQIVAAASAHAVDAVGLSFSAFYSPRAAVSFIAKLREQLAPGTALWIGGACVGLDRINVEGVERFVGLDTIGSAIAAMSRSISA